MSSYLLIAFTNKTKVVRAAMYCGLSKLFLTQIAKKQTKKNILSASFSELIILYVMQIPITNRLNISFDKKNPFFTKRKCDERTMLPIFEQEFFKCSMLNKLLPL